MQGTCWYALFISILDEEVVAGEQDVAGSTLTYVRSLMPDNSESGVPNVLPSEILTGAKEVRERRRIRGDERNAEAGNGESEWECV